MRRRYLFELFALLSIPLMQVAASSFLGSLFYFNGVVVTLVFLLMLARAESSIYFVLISGFILDMYAHTAFGVFLVALAGTALVVQTLHLNLLTNRSLYSLLLLVLIATIIFHVLFVGSVSVLYALGWHASMVMFEYWKLFIGSIISNVLCSLFIFIIVNRYSTLFKPTYLQS